VSLRAEPVTLRIKVTRKQHFPEALEEPLPLPARQIRCKIVVWSK